MERRRCSVLLGGEGAQAGTLRDEQGRRPTSANLCASRATTLRATDSASRAAVTATNGSMPRAFKSFIACAAARGPLPGRR